MRLSLIAAWRDATVFTEPEKAALELTEQGTRLADGRGVTDEAWVNAARHYDEDQLAALVALVALINAYNRLNVITAIRPVTTSPVSGPRHGLRAESAQCHVAPAAPVRKWCSSRPGRRPG